MQVPECKYHNVDMDTCKGLSTHQFFSLAGSGGNTCTCFFNQRQGSPATTCSETYLHLSLAFGNHSAPEGRTRHAKWTLVFCTAPFSVTTLGQPHSTWGLAPLPRCYKACPIFTCPGLKFLYPFFLAWAKRTPFGIVSCELTIICSNN